MHVLLCVCFCACRYVGMVGRGARDRACIFAPIRTERGLRVTEHVYASLIHCVYFFLCVCVNRNERQRMDDTKRLLADIRDRILQAPVANSNTGPAPYQVGCIHTHTYTHTHTNRTTLTVNPGAAWFLLRCGVMCVVMCVVVCVCVCCVHRLSEVVSLVWVVWAC